MKRKLMVTLMCLTLSGCSASSLLPGLIGSKPDVTAQAGSENTKQTVGLTAKKDESSKQETTFKESAVGKVDTSNKKQVSTSSIKADNITADKIEIRNGDPVSNYLPIALFIGWILGVVTMLFVKRNKAA